MPSREPTPPFCLTGKDLPAELLRLSQPPERLFVQGRVPPQPVVAVVGTRRPSPEGERFAFQLAADLARAGVTVASGGALGVDSAAHRGALFGGGRTVVVAPSSFDQPYPEENAGLFAEIVAKGGACLSEHEHGVQPRRHHFFRRNWLLVALAHALVVVEAPLRSGARNAALCARRLQIPYFVVPSAPWSPTGSGCVAELQLGGLPLFNYKDVLKLLQLTPLQLTPHGTPGDAATDLARPLLARQLTLGTAYRRGAAASLPAASAMAASVTAAPSTAAFSPHASSAALPETQRAALAVLGDMPLHVDVLAERLGMPLGTLSVLMLELALQGYVIAHSGSRYSRAGETPA